MPELAPPERIVLDDLDEGATILCATHRLARNLRIAADRRRLAAGQTRWSPLLALTPAQWLAGLFNAALLSGELPAETAPRLVLSPLAERVVWDRAIAACADGDAEEALFDRDGLADAAAEAHGLMLTWGIRVGGDEGGDMGDESRRFLRWRGEFLKACAAAGWFDAARLFDWQVSRLAEGIGRLPGCVAFAGFDRYNPQEMRLRRTLAGRGVAVREVQLERHEAAPAVAVELADRAGECRAAVAWAKARLERDPAARLGIVVPELGALRGLLADALDDALHPASVGAAYAEAPRRYNFSLGTPLAAQPLVDVALRLLGLAARPQQVAQAEFGELLRRPGWSADVGEADGRALLDARLRRHLPPVVSFERLLGFARRAAGRGLPLGRLVADLAGLQGAVQAQPRRRLPSAWPAAIRTLLAAAGWPGERGLSSHEFQARRAFLEIVDGLAPLDAVLGPLPFAEALRRLGQLCRERIFQAETEGDPPLQVMGPLEAAGVSLDALWVMGMNDHVWPPPARPNPLLPAALQRRAGAPGASAAVQGEFAAAIHRRLLHSAAELVFSFAHAEADRELRPSPLLEGLPRAATEAFPPAPSLLEQLRGDGPWQRLDDATGPPLAAGEAVAGGTALLRAQAICPAWAFYQFRLGATALQTPEEGLDAAQRGSLLHLALARFWTGRSSADLAAMDAGARDRAVVEAIAAAIAAFLAAAGEPPTPRLLELEAERLRALLGGWLEVEAARPLLFRVVACEEQLTVDIEGIVARLVIDRIDELDDGRRLVIDYKSGRAVSSASWAAPRISEPQLPIYAGQGGAELAAVAFARVRPDACGFVGIAAEDGLLPKVPGLDSKEGRKQFAADGFPDWSTLLARWQERIAAVAREVRTGEAAVRFSDAKELAYCEVLPLLRLAERRAQIEEEDGS